jgi:putative transposase
MRAFAVGQRREMAETAVARRGASIALACRAFGVRETCYRYEAKHNAENKLIANWAHPLNGQQPQLGLWAVLFVPA